MFKGFRTVEVDSDLINKLYNDNQIDIWDKRYNFSPNLYLELKDTSDEKHTALAKVSKNCQSIKKISCGKVSGVEPRNREQVFALDALMDEQIPVVVLTGPAGTGKAQPLDAKIATPSGWLTMGEMKKGITILAPDGKHTKVLDIFPQGKKDIFRVCFSDGTYTECCDDHLWYTRTQLERDSGSSGRVRSLKEIRKTLRYGVCRKRNHMIPMVEEISFDTRKLPIDPYLLGILLGDGSMSIGCPMLSTADPEIIYQCQSILEKYDMVLRHASNYDYRIIHLEKPSWKEGNYIKNQLKKMGLWGSTSDTKFIPQDFKFNSFENRVSILQGLLDSDGTIDKRTGNITITTVSQQLANDIVFLVQSLGGKALIKSRVTQYTYNNEKRKGKISFRISLSLNNNIVPFRLTRKKDFLKEKVKYFPCRYIDKVVYVGKKEAQCILIDHPKHLYITDNFIVTHNTLLSLAVSMNKMENNRYKKTVLTKPMSEVTKYKLGALPGDVEEKFSPYLINYMTNLEQFVKDKNIIKDLMQQSRFEMIPLQLFRGASFANMIVIADEVQILNSMEMLTIGTRMGENSKLIIMGDLNQRDEKIQKEKTGIYKLVNSELARESPLVAVVELEKCERSQTAKLFSSIFQEK